MTSTQSIQVRDAVLGGVHTTSAAWQLIKYMMALLSQDLNILEHVT